MCPNVSHLIQVSTKPTGMGIGKLTDGSLQNPRSLPILSSFWRSPEEAFVFFGLFCVLGGF
jgi:hypothetical protein